MSILEEYIKYNADQSMSRGFSSQRSKHIALSAKYAGWHLTTVTLIL